MPATKTVDSWMSALDSALRTVAMALRQLILEADPELSEDIKWGNPVYEKHGKVCYLASTKGYVSLGFFNGAELTDPRGRIEGTGKSMRHIKVRSLEDIQHHDYTYWVREAVGINASRLA